MLLATLVILNIPIFLLVGWALLDSPEDAADTLFDTIVAVLKMILIPKIIRVMMGEDDDDAWGLIPLALFLLTCAAIVYGEHRLITTYFLDN